MSQKAQGSLQDSIDGLAALLALIAAFLATPMLDKFSSETAMNIVSSAYGQEYVPLARFVWTLLLGGMVFFITRALIALAIMIITASAIGRFGAFI